MATNQLRIGRHSIFHANAGKALQGLRQSAFVAESLSVGISKFKGGSIPSRLLDCVHCFCSVASALLGEGGERPQLHKLGRVNNMATRIDEGYWAMVASDDTLATTRQLNILQPDEPWTRLVAGYARTAPKAQWSCRRHGVVACSKCKKHTVPPMRDYLDPVLKLQSGQLYLGDATPSEHDKAFEYRKANCLPVDYSPFSDTVAEEMKGRDSFNVAKELRQHDASLERDYLYVTENRVVRTISAKQFADDSIPRKSKDGKPLESRVSQWLAKGFSFATPSGFREDGTFWKDEEIVEVRKDVPLVQTSYGVEFDEETLEQETYKQRRHRLLACRRWRARRDCGNRTTFTRGFNGQRGDRIPLLRLEQLELNDTGRAVYFAQKPEENDNGTLRYLSTSIWRAWLGLVPSLSPALGLRGGFVDKVTGRMTGGNLRRHPLWFEFLADCVQEISIHWLAMFSDVERYSGLSRGISAVETIFWLRFGYDKKGKLERAIPISEKREEREEQVTILVNNLKRMATPRQRNIAEAIQAGCLSCTAIANKLGCSVNVVRDDLALLKRMNIREKV